MPEVRDDLESLFDPTALEEDVRQSIAAGFQLFWTADEARYAFFKSASATASCAQEVVVMWRLLFGTQRIRDDPAVPGYEWVDSMNMSGVCD